jgi:hypothetical protein
MIAGSSRRNGVLMREGLIGRRRGLAARRPADRPAA